MAPPDEELPDDEQPPPDDQPDPGDEPGSVEPGRVEFDAPLEEKQAFGQWVIDEPLGRAIDPPATGREGATRRVVLPGQAATNAVGPRQPRRAAAVGGDAEAGARHNWIPTGPRNVGGRVRALAIHPTDQRIMYAGTASGGVHKTADGGETWFPLWHEEPSLAVASISICRDHPEVVWAATGEVQTGGGELIRGNGVYRSSNNGEDWSNDAAVPVPGTIGPPDTRAFSFDAIAAHPVERDRAWAVGPTGVFRTMDHGQNWQHFDAGTYYSDVVFSQTGAGALLVYVVRAASTAGEVTIVRIDNPDDPNVANIAAAFAAGAANLITVDPGPGALQADPPTRGKLAICAANRNVAYVRYVTSSGRNYGIFRTRRARDVPANTIPQWTRLPDHPDVGDEGQGSYNLSIAVSPRSTNHVATGMQELYLSRNANHNTPASVRWRRAMATDLFHIDRAHHADNHQAIFAPLPGAAAATPPALWVANDGGISVSTDWHDTTRTGYELGSTTLPLPPRPITWRKRSHGISASQMYDLSQSPLVPSLFGCGFQDNGLFVTQGGQTWRFVLSADGGFVAFDPDDPYLFIATWQLGISEVTFPGRLEGLFPTPGDAVQDGLWPRIFMQGFLPPDVPIFGPDTVHHERKRGRVLHARRNRLYGRTRARGDRFEPEGAGRGLDLVFGAAGSASTLRVQPTPGASRLGIYPQVSQVPSGPASVRSWRPGPYRLRENDTLQYVRNGTPGLVTFRRGGLIPDLDNASVAEVAAYIRNADNLINAQPAFWARPWTVEITTDDVGRDARISLGGTGANNLGYVSRVYNGDANRPASVSLFARNLDMRGGLHLLVKIADRPQRRLEFSSPPFANLASIRAGELASALSDLLENDPVTVTAVTPRRTVRLTATAGPGFILNGTALPALNLAAPTPAAQTLTIPRSFFNGWALAGAPPLNLTVNDQVNPVPAPLQFAGRADITNFGNVTAEELQRMLAGYVAGLAVSVDVEATYDPSEPTAIAFAPNAPDTVWVGGQDGVLHRSEDDGGHWTPIQHPLLTAQSRAVEAIAIHPEDPQTVFVGLEGPPNGAADPGMLFRTTDGGRRWQHVGAEIVDAGNPGLGIAPQLVGIHALQVDPDVPARVYAATDAGVFRSTDGGNHWRPFNEGLPNAPVRDLAFARSTRTLRAGAWGRGTFERHVGDRPPKDVHLYLRTSELDVGQRPAPRGPDVFATAPAPALPIASPDVKVARDRPRQIGADDLVDGVEFDEDIRHEAPAPGPTLVFVQVHNRGSFVATEVRRLAMWADVAGGPPPLPADFWTRFAGPGALAGDLGAWHVIGDVRIVDPTARGRVDSGYPRVHTFTGFSWPADLDTHRRIGILVLVSCKEDPLAATATDVPALLATEPKVAYRETATVRAVDDRRVFLRATTGLQFRVAAPGGGATPAALGFGALPIGPVSELRGGLEPFNLSAGAPQQLRFSVDPQAVTVTFGGRPAVQAIAAATVQEVRSLINRDLRNLGVPVRCESYVPAPGQTGIRLRARGTSRVQLTGGTAAANLFPAAAVGAAPAARIDGLPGTYNLSAGAPQTLTLSVTAGGDVSLPQGDDAIPALATARARDVRRVLNRRFAAAGLPIEAVVPGVDLWVRRSVTDADGVPASPNGRHLADIVAEPVATAPGPLREGLFDLVRVHALDRLKRAAGNFLYLRSANLGTAPQRDARHRLFRLNLAATPIATAPIGGAVTETVPAGGAAIVQFEFNPGNVDVGSREFVLGVCDHAADRPLVVPPEFTTVAELDDFCARNPNAAYREFVVGP